MPAYSQVVGSLFATHEFDPRRTGRVLRRRLPNVLLSAIASGVVGFVIGFLAPASYTATAKVILPGSQASTASTSSTSSSNGRVAATEIELLNSAPVQQSTDKAVGHSITISITPVTGSDVADVAATSKTPQTAANDANAYVKTYLALRTAQLAAPEATATKSLQAQLAATAAALKPLDAQLSALTTATAGQLQQILAIVGPQRDALVRRQAALQTQLDQITLQSEIGSFRPRLGAAATAPTTADLHKPAVYAGVGVLLGLLAGGWLALLLERRRGRVHDGQDIVDAGVDAGLVAAVPKQRGSPGLLSGDAQSSAAAMLYRRVAAALMLGYANHADCTILVLPVDGRTLTALPAANLALALTSMGRRVVLVDLDLDQPSLHGLFGVRGEKGVRGVLQGLEPLSGALVTVSDGTIHLLPAGATYEARRADIAALPDIFADLRTDYDTIVVAAASTDTSDVAITATPLADITILLAEQGRARKVALAAAAHFAQRLGQAPSAILLVPPAGRRSTKVPVAGQGAEPAEELTQLGRR
ncbi:MAG: Wzz/FepE/Etk N-terminal domain-containing protein [Pseudonocardiales bacterium]